MDENNLQEKRSPDGEENGRPGFSVLREGRKLQDMTMEQLRDRFEMLFGEAPAQHLTALHLTKRILWRLQEIRYGGLTAESEKALDEAADADAAANLRPHKASRPERVDGVQLEKVWRGKVHKVTMRGDGKVEYDGRIFRSLSAVAKAITGTHWNGKAFFGVK